MLHHIGLHILNISKNLALINVASNRKNSCGNKLWSISQAHNFVKHTGLKPVSLPTTPPGINDNDSHTQLCAREGTKSNQRANLLTHRNQGVRFISTARLYCISTCIIFLAYVNSTVNTNSISLGYCYTFSSNFFITFSFKWIHSMNSFKWSSSRIFKFFGFACSLSLIILHWT